MRQLRLVGLGTDGQHVVFVDDAGVEFAAPADERLRAALRGDRARLGQLEIEMESALRPRDIQARVRAGEDPEAVASLAGVPVDRIMAYCVPVLAERQHVAELAGRSHVRRAGAEGPARRLEDVIRERLSSRGIDADTTVWDAWRRDDGRWTVRAGYHSGESERQASFVFDLAGRYTVADDDEAKWLTGERQHTSKGPQPREGGRPPARRLTAVPTDDLLSLSERDDDIDYDELSDDLTAVVRAVREVDVVVLEPVAEPAQAEEHSAPESEPEPDSGPESEPETEPEPAGAAAADPAGEADLPAAVNDTAGAGSPDEPERRRRPRRPSVPSWDEIMLGRRGES